MYFSLFVWRMALQKAVELQAERIEMNVIALFGKQ